MTPWLPIVHLSKVELKKLKVERPCPAETPSDCVLARLPSGQINWNPYPGTPDYNAACAEACRTGGGTTGQVYASADVLEDAVGSGRCTFSQTTTCTCPKDCVGHWRDTGTSEKSCGWFKLGVGGSPGSGPYDSGDYTQTATYRNEEFVVDTEAQGTGSCPDRGRTRQTRTNICYTLWNTTTCHNPTGDVYGSASTFSLERCRTTY